MTDDPEQAEREIEARAAMAGRDGQTEFFREAIKQALQAANLELGASGIQPRIDAVIAATTMIQADFVAMYPNRAERRMRQIEIEQNLKRLVTLRTSMGQKPAKALAPDLADTPAEGQG